MRTDRVSCVRRGDLKVDSSEANSGIPRRLAAIDGVRVTESRLDCGDYLCSDAVAIERKTATDFIASIMDRRLFEQVAHMIGTFETSILLLEGDPYSTRSGIATIARPAQYGLGYEIALRAAKPNTLDVQRQFLIEGLPGIGPGRAKKLLEHFGTPLAVFQANMEQLQAVPGIGASAASGIFRVLHEQPE
jgi:ERCC4-type nuclease